MPLIKEVPLMHRTLFRGLLCAATMVVTTVGVTSTPVSAAPTSHSTAQGIPSHGLPSLRTGTCTLLWDLLNAGGRNGLVAVGLTADQQLIKFAVNTPALACTIGSVDLPGSEVLIGIDFRVQDGNLYGVGNTGGVYALSTRTAVATKVSQLTVALNGTSFGVDFNPAADRLRVISDTGQNLRHNINPGGTTVVDGPLTYPPATAAIGVTGAAYTNNDLNPATATTLFDIDTTLDQVALQSPANSGQLAATGSLGVNAALQAGFDIHSALRGDRAVANNAYAVLNGAAGSRVYRVDLLTGEAHTTGSFSGRVVLDLALLLRQ
ncbi:DUF4394 domain-containing protein [Verrucosispora sp. SN26_14.1]|uniref:DUF4394 domain-containing protein n=1 Tax=Verrucosispora sp. SN26_14.1 TaxID=2527879 RepID=UPI0019137BDF|nr:DUF4394 domain-containing protein [Verrucosispora sp. SN26_14.1]